MSNLLSTAIITFNPNIYNNGNSVTCMIIDSFPKQAKKKWEDMKRITFHTKKSPCYQIYRIDLIGYLRYCSSNKVIHSILNIVIKQVNIILHIRDGISVAIINCYNNYIIYRICKLRGIKKKITWTIGEASLTSK